MLKIPAPIVSVEWLNSNLDADNLLVFDATIAKVTAKNEGPESFEFIENAQFLDIKKVFSNTNAPFPNTMLSPSEFEIKAQEMGVNNNSCIVVYDRYGYYSAARVWWMFNSMGFHNIAVLDGGLPEWKIKGYPTQKNASTISDKGNFKAVYSENKIIDHHKVLKAIECNDIAVIDARSTDRFLAQVEEPRPGLRSGHIPNSENIPYTTLLSGTKMKSENELKSIFEPTIKKEVIFSCGSGITACVLALGATIAGYKNLKVYDGSWTEWGSLHELPIEK